MPKRMARSRCNIPSRLKVQYSIYKTRPVAHNIKFENCLPNRFAFSFMFWHSSIEFQNSCAFFDIFSDILILYPAHSFTFIVEQVCLPVIFRIAEINLDNWFT